MEFLVSISVLILSFFCGKITFIALLQNSRGKLLRVSPNQCPSAQSTQNPACSPIAEARRCLQAAQPVWVGPATYRASSSGVPTTGASRTGRQAGWVPQTSYGFAICIKIEKLYRNNRSLQQKYNGTNIIRLG